MASLIEHLLKLSEHRDRDLLELTLAKALIALLPIQRVVIAHVVNGEGEKRWLEVASLDAGGGGKVADPLRANFQALQHLEDAPDRWRCVQDRAAVEVAWGGELGPRITLFPLFSDSSSDDAGVIEIHSAATLSEESLQAVGYLTRIYRSMYSLLQYSDRDALTGLLNRKSLDDAFYSAVLEELDGVAGDASGAAKVPVGYEKERRHRVPPNYWLGTVVVDDFNVITDKHGHLIAEEAILLVARILNNTFRTHDRVYHFGGGHFAVLFHCPEEPLALGAFERFSSNMERFHFPQVGRVTASSGFTNVMVDDSPSTTLERCARAIEFAQKNGRNKVCSHLELVRRGLFDESARVGGVELF